MIGKNSSTVAVAALIALMYALAYSVEFKRVRGAQSRSLAAHVIELDRQITQLSFVPKLLSDDVAISNAVLEPTPNNIKTANLRLEKAQHQSGLEFAFLMDVDGLTIASSNWNETPSFVSQNYSFRPYFKGAILGRTATFFAVGATTGIPGYFIAEPVLAGSVIKGVVVTKTTLAAPVDTWRELDFESAVVDEFGVIILASDRNFLYLTTRTISDEDRSRIELERRYPLSPIKGSDSEARLASYRSYSRELKAEPWKLMALVPRSSYHLRALVISAIASALSFIAFLLVRNYRQQKALVANEQRHSKELEDQVVKRTRELEETQHALISESNYAVLGRMSAAINHEINQPLASLRLNLASLRKLITKQGDNTREIEEIVVESDRTTKRIGLVITSLRNYARNDKMRFVQVDVQDVITEVVNVLRSERPTMSKHLIVDTYLEKPFVEGDKVLLQQALLNLLYNALDTVIDVEAPKVRIIVGGTQTGTEIETYLQVNTTGANSPEIDSTRLYVVISVEDNGGGVAEEIIPTLFDPFTTDSGNKGGLGLGLTIAKQIAESHNGFMGYSDITRGSRFSLVLPVI